MPSLPSLAIVGAGPRGIGVLERLAANAAGLLADVAVVVHVIDPYPPGPGRVWRHDQSPLLLLNSMARDVTVWTDDSVRMRGPARPGPTLAEWARDRAADGVVGPDGTPDEDLTAEAACTTGVSFPSRRLQRAYLAWYFEQSVESLPDSVEVVVHADRVVDVTDRGAVPPSRDGRQVVHLGSGGTLEVDAVIMTLGHLDRDPDGAEAVLADFASQHRVTYVPPGYTADEDLSALRAGEDVIVRGMGLAFVDLVVLLTEGRGGRYDEDGTGRLRYTPSGAEPTLWVGSRRGVPYRAKLTYDLLGGRPDLPRYFSGLTVAALAGRHERLDFRTHVWPLVAKELAWAYYRELALGHPDRVALDFDELDARFAEAGWATPAMEALVTAAVPAAEDRLDLAALDRPLAGVRFDDAATLEAHVVAHIEADVARRGDRRFSADLGLFMAALTSVGTMPRVLATGKLSTRSRVEDVDGWWWGFFSYYASGPPPERLRQLVALHRAGLVRFLGAGMWVEADADRGRWRAGGVSAPVSVEAGALVDARLPRPSVSRSRDPLVRSLRDRREVGEEVLSDGGGAASWRTGYLTVDGPTTGVLDADGRRHPRRFALGANTSTGRGGAFARPRTNAPAFRQNDAAARAVLELLAGIAEPAALAD